MTIFSILTLLNLVSTLNLPLGTSPDDLLYLARLACSEAGYSRAESKRVMRVVYNRAKLNGTSVIDEAKRPYQFYAKNCQGRRESSLRWHHFEVAIAALNGTIEAEASINQNATHFATTKRLKKPHSRCKGYTIGQVWKWYGLRKVFTSEVGHEFFSKKGGRAGCPPSKNTAGSHSARSW